MAKKNKAGAESAPTPPTAPTDPAATDPAADAVEIDPDAAGVAGFDAADEAAIVVPHSPELAAVVAAEPADVVGRIGFVEEPAAPSSPTTSPAELIAAAGADPSVQAELDAALKRIEEIGDPIAWRNEPIRMRENLQKVFDAQKADFTKAMGRLEDEQRARFASCQALLAEKTRLEKTVQRLRRTIGAAE